MNVAPATRAWYTCEVAARLVVASLAALVLAAGASGSVGRVQAAPAHVVFTSDRDGDDDVYAVAPGGGRLAALTRNRVEDAGVLSPDGTRLVDVRGNGPSASRMVLVSADGRSETDLGAGTPSRFLTGDRLAFQAQSPSDGSTSVGVVSLDGSGRRTLPLQSNDQIVGWWPDGSRLLVIAPAADDLEEVAFPGGSRTTIASGVFAAGLSDLGLVWFTRAGDASLHVFDVDGAGAPASLDFADVIGWSPDGRRLAYLTGSLPSPTLTLYDPASRTSTPLAALPGRVADSAWAPDGTRLALHVDLLDAQGVATRQELVVAGADGSLATVLGSIPGTFIQKLAWSPDGTMLAVGDDYRVVVVPATGGAPRVVSGRGNALLVGWAAGAVSAAAPPARALPEPEIAGPKVLRTAGRIVELAASGRWVAVSVLHDALDCDHVAAWRAGTSRTVRFSRVAPCLIEFPADVLSHLAVSGTRVTWWDTVCEGSCDSNGVRGDLRAPGRSTPATGNVLRRKPPPRLILGSETGGGVTVALRRGTLVLRHAGRRRTLRPPGGAVDAELTAAGLFYAYDVRGSTYRGRVAFVPRAVLLRTLR